MSLHEDLPDLPGVVSSDSCSLRDQLLVLRTPYSAASGALAMARGFTFEAGGTS